MKNVKTTFIFLFLLSSFLSSAQSLGFKGGVIFNDVKVKFIDNSGLIDLSTKDPELAIGYQIGIMYKKEINNFFSVKTELSYMEKGANNLFEIDKTAKFHYFDFSFLAMLQVIKNGTIDIGMEPAFLVRNRPVVDRFDFGLIGGVSYLVKNKIELSVRYFYGLTPLLDITLVGATAEEEGSLEYYNRNLMISVGYYFL